MMDVVMMCRSPVPQTPAPTVVYWGIDVREECIQEGTLRGADAGTDDKRSSAVTGCLPSRRPFSTGSI